MILYWLDLFGVVVFAISGALEAGRKRLDLFGTLVIAVVTAIGGGTLRDVILSSRPVFWIADSNYLVVAIGAGALTFVLGQQRGRARPGTATALLVADALGLAVFTVLGCQKALALDTPPLVAVIMGMMSGVVGGMIRDVLCGDIPLVLHKEIYATASLVGGTVYMLLRHLGWEDAANTLVASAVVFVIRLLAIRLNLSLPVFPDTASPTK
jgi:uncharacterized membrane protein YeiH